MNKWFKRTLVGVSVMVLTAILVLALGYRQLRGTPDWYATRRAWTPEQLESFAAKAEKNLANLNNWADQARGDMNRASSTNPSGLPAPNTQPAAKTFTVEFTEDEINAILQKYLANTAATDKVSKYITDLAILLDDDGQVVLAGNVKDMNTVASAHFMPKIDPKADVLHLRLTKVLGGRLPLPDSLWSSQRAKAANALESQLPVYRSEARIDSKGTANYAAVNLALFQTLLNILTDRPSSSTILLPVAGKGAVPAHLTAVSVADKTLSLTVEPVTPAQRQAFLDSLRAPTTPTASIAH